MVEFDFKRFPELRDNQVGTLYFASPHKQIFEGFRAKVVKVVDGDTVRLLWDQRDFDFPMRLSYIDAPEGKEGEEAKSWLEDQVLDQEVDIEINRNNRVGKFGRLIGRILHNGLDMGTVMLQMDLVKPFNRRDEGKIPEINKELRINQWL